MVREVFEVTPDEWQDDLMVAVARGDRRISVVSGHGVGKTTVLAWIIVWWLITRFPQKTVCTAPTTKQLFDALFTEVKAWIGKLPPDLRALFEIKADEIRLAAAPDESLTSFRTSRPEMPEALAGVHSDNVLLVGDEASGIPEPVYEAASGSMSGHSAVTILAGNPVRSSGLFFETHHKLKDLWTTFHVSCVGHPRVTPDFVAEMGRRYGENSNAFRVRVLGLFPLKDDDTIIPYELMASALKRDVKPQLVRPVWGLDCARFGTDSSALAKRQGNVLLEPVTTWHGLDTMQTCGRVKGEWEATLTTQRPEEICVDAIGIGAGVADRLMEMGLPARAVNVSESPSLGHRFRNLRAELWWALREWLSKRDVNLSNDEELGRELVLLKYHFTLNGKIQIESKDDLKKRGFASPDRGDALMLTFASTAMVALHGDTQRLSWNQPLKRYIAGIV